MRRLVLAPLLALLLLMSTVAGAVANGVTVSGELVEAKSAFSTFRPAGDDLLWSRAILFYNGEMTVGAEQHQVTAKVVMARTFDGADSTYYLDGTWTFDLRAFGYGKCSGPFAGTMTPGADDSYPSTTEGTAVCGNGAVLELVGNGAYQADGFYHQVMSGSYITMPD